MPTEKVDRLTAAETRRLVLSDDAEAQAWFAKTFAADLRAACHEWTRAWNSYRALGDAIQLEKRAAEVMLMVHNALNSVLTAMHLMASGFPVPAGNMMRQFAECVAMAMLFSDASLPTFDLFVADRGRFAVHKAPAMITQQAVSSSLQKTLHLDKRGYQEFLRVMRFYDKLSHASAVTLGYSFMFSKSGGLVIGSQVDPSKRKQYQAEIRQFARAATTIRHLVSALDGALDKRA